MADIDWDSLGPEYSFEHSYKSARNMRHLEAAYNNPAINNTALLAALNSGFRGIYCDLCNAYTELANLADPLGDAPRKCPTHGFRKE